MQISLIGFNFKCPQQVPKKASYLRTFSCNNGGGRLRHEEIPVRFRKTGSSVNRTSSSGDSQNNPESNSEYICLFTQTGQLRSHTRSSWIKLMDKK